VVSRALALARITAKRHDMWKLGSPYISNGQWLGKASTYSQTNSL